MRAFVALFLLPPLAVLFLVGSLLSGVTALLTPERTLAVLDRSGALPTLYRYGLESLANAPTGEDYSGPLGLDHPAFADLIEAVLPEPQVEEWIHTGIPALYAWLDSDDPSLRVPLDLRAMKARLGPALYAVLEERASSVGPCTEEEARDLADGKPAFCRLPGDSDERVVQRARESGAVEDLVARFPDTVNVPDFTVVQSTLGTSPGVATPPPADASLDRIRGIYRQRIAVTASVWMLAGFLLLLAALLHRTPTRRLLRWLGLALLAAGLLPLVLGLAGIFGAPGSTIAARLPESLAPDVRAALGRLIAAAVAELLRLPLLFGGFAVVAGILGVVFSLLHPHPRHERKAG